MNNRTDKTAKAINQYAMVFVVLMDRFIFIQNKPSSGCCRDSGFVFAPPQYVTFTELQRRLLLTKSLLHSFPR